MKITEAPSKFQDIDKMSVVEVLSNINKEDSSIPAAVASQIPIIESLVI